MTGTWIVTGLASAVSLLGAAMVVRTKDLVHAVLWLALTLLGTAAAYAVLDAGFLAAIQVLLYTGGVITLMLFAVLLARRSSGAIPAGESVGKGAGAVFALLVFGLVASGVLRSELPTETAQGPDAKALGALFLGELMLPFETLSVLLLGAMVGAIVLARKKDEA